MKEIVTYIIEKLRINKDTKINDVDPDIKKISENLGQIMFKMNWYGPEYEFRTIDRTTISISFLINITEKDINNTIIGLRNRLKELLNHTDFYINRDLKDYKHNILISTQQ